MMWSWVIYADAALEYMWDQSTCMVDWNSGRSDELGVQYTMPCQVLQYRYSIVPDSFPGRHYLYQVWSLLPDIKVRVCISSNRQWQCIICRRTAVLGGGLSRSRSLLNYGFVTEFQMFPGSQNELQCRSPILASPIPSSVVSVWQKARLGVWVQVHSHRVCLLTKIRYMCIFSPRASW